MYCRNCGKKLDEDDLFCSACGTKVINEVLENEKGTENEEEIQTEDIVQEDVNITDEKRLDCDIKTEQIQSEKSGISSIKTIFLLICIAITVVGICYGSRLLQEKKRKQEILERNQRIESTLVTLGNRSSGSTDFNTAQYSMALSFFTSAALGKSNISNYAGLNAEEIKAECFKTLEAYFERDYVKSYAALLFCADYFTKADVEYFYNGTKIREQELKECVKALLFENNISLSNLLVDEQDELICYTMNLRIRLANDGYLPTEDIITELYQFVCDGEPIRMVRTELLAEEIAYEEIAKDIENSFTVDKLIYFDNLSPVGKMVFLYLMPRYVVQFDQEAGDALWNDYYFKTRFDNCWEEIVERDIFSTVLE